MKEKTYAGIPAERLAAEGFILKGENGQKALNVKAKDLHLFSNSLIRKVQSGLVPTFAELSPSHGKLKTPVMAILKNGKTKMVKLKHALKHQLEYSV